MRWFRSLTGVFLMSISLALLISEWRSLRASWTELEASGQLSKNVTFLLLLTFSLSLVHWALVLCLSRDIGEDTEQDGMSDSRADNGDAPDE